MLPRSTRLFFGVLLASACQSERVMSPSHEVASAVAVTYDWLSAGGLHSCISRTTAAPAWTKLCWGGNFDGQVGSGSSLVGMVLPVTVTNTTGSHFVLGDGGYAHTCAISNGRAYCWGRNSSGQLGNGTTTNSNVPVLVSGGITWTKVIAGSFHTCGVNNLGVAYCWGQGTYGQLGYGGTTDKTVPTPVSTAIAFSELTAGEQFTCGLQKVTTPPAAIYCWGANPTGQLGTGTTIGLLTPGAAVVGGAKFSALSAGSLHVCAINYPSLLVSCWGDNHYTQLGIAETTHNLLYKTPQPVAFNYRMTPVVSGASHSCGRRDTGVIYCWGRGDLGSLGNGFFVNRPTPYPVAGNSTYKPKLAAGNFHMLAVRSNGVVVSWGYNVYGQLGDGTTNTRGAPVVILPATQ
jgi:alpha-tubulin suppressor-like RCC1 family protein